MRESGRKEPNIQNLVVFPRWSPKSFQTCAATEAVNLPKNEADSSIRSKIVRGSQNLEIRSRDPGHAHLVVVLWSLSRETLAVLYACTKFEADSSFRSKVIRGSLIFEIRPSRDPGHAHLVVVLYSLRRRPLCTNP